LLGQGIAGKTIGKPTGKAIGTFKMEIYPLVKVYIANWNITI
jgi:hypothetical protein